jgi:hypothetical protein
MANKQQVAAVAKQPKKIIDAAKAPVKADNLDKRIDAVLKRSNTLAADLHKIMVECLTHAEQHNDPRKLDRIYHGLHKASRPEAFKVWVEKFSPVRWNGDGKVGMLKQTAKNYVPFDVKGADAEPYWTPQEVIQKPLTLAALKKMIEQMEKKLAKAEEEGRIAEGENVIDMRAFVAKVTAAAEVQAAA